MVERSTAATDAGTLLELLHRLSGQLSTLFHQEVKLATSEVSNTLTGLFLQLTSVVSGGAVLYAGFLLLLLSAVLGLATIVPLWLASLLIGVTVVITGSVLVLAGKRKLKSADLIPTHSAASLRRDRDILTGKGS